MSKAVYNLVKIPIFYHSVQFKNHFIKSVYTEFVFLLFHFGIGQFVPLWGTLLMLSTFVRKNSNN